MRLSTVFIDTFINCPLPVDPRFPEYGKVELVFSEGPERIPGRFLEVGNGSGLALGVVRCNPPPSETPVGEGMWNAAEGKCSVKVCADRGVKKPSMSLLTARRE